MAQSRLHLAFDGAPAGRILLLGAEAGDDLSPFDPARTQVAQGFFPDHQAIAARGYEAVVTPAGDFDGAVVFVPRSRALGRARIAAAVALLRPEAQLWIDGQKTDGIDAVLREIRTLASVDEVHSRAHGKIFKVIAPDAGWVPEDWAERVTEVVPGMVTRPGVFSADGPDPGSQALVAALPDKLPTRIVELGCGWGWLGAQLLARRGVETLHLVEADAAALDCAKRNLSDERAQFHWADARDFRLPDPVNGVVMNPPFHDGRAGDPRLGIGFIQTAAALLTGAGRLWMVANRHLPYEEPLRAAFAEVEEIAGDSRFKVLTASGPGRGQVPKPGRRR